MVGRVGRELRRADGVPPTIIIHTTTSLDGQTFSLFMTMDHVSDPKVINMRLCKGSREIFRISSICLTSCYLSLLATQHACAWD